MAAVEATEHDQLMLRVLPPRYGLPSFDPHCLAVYAYCKFGRAIDQGSIKVNQNYLSWFGLKSDVDQFPVFYDGNNEHRSVETIIDRLRQLGYGSDFKLSQKENSDSLAFIEMMKYKLRPAVMHTYWLEASNQDYSHRREYAAAMPFPGNILYLRNLSHQAHKVVYTSSTATTNFLSTDQVEKRIYKDAVKCISYLSDKLGSKAFLFGNTPSTADAIMFGYLAPILKINFPQNRLKGHLESYQNVCNTIEHIIRKVFSSYDLGLQETARSNIQPSRPHASLDDDFPHKARNTFIATVFCLTVIVTYALLRGVIPMEISEIEVE